MLVTRNCRPVLDQSKATSGSGVWICSTRPTYRTRGSPGLKLACGWRDSAEAPTATTATTSTSSNTSASESDERAAMMMMMRLGSASRAASLVCSSAVARCSAACATSLRLPRTTLGPTARATMKLNTDYLSRILSCPSTAVSSKQRTPRSGATPRAATATTPRFARSSAKESPGVLLISNAHERNILTYYNLLYTDLGFKVRAAAAPLLRCSSAARH